MVKTRLKSIAIVLLLTTTLVGCSFLMQTAASVRQPGETPDCTDSYIMPINDVLQALFFAMQGILAVSGDSYEWGSSTRGYIYLGTGAIYAGAAIYGFVTASRCRKARSEYDASCKRTQELLTRALSNDEQPLVPRPEGEATQ